MEWNAAKLRVRGRRRRRGHVYVYVHPVFVCMSCLRSCSHSPAGHLIAAPAAGARRLRLMRRWARDSELGPAVVSGSSQASMQHPWCSHRLVTTELAQYTNLPSRTSLCVRSLGRSSARRVATAGRSRRRVAGADCRWADRGRTRARGGDEKAGRARAGLIPSTSSATTTVRAATSSSSRSSSLHPTA